MLTTKKIRLWFIVCVSLILTWAFSFPFGTLSPPAIAQDNVDSGEARQAMQSWRAAATAAALGDFSKAVINADAAMSAGLTDSMIFYHRGRWNFQDGKIAASLRDFNEFVRLVPQRANAQWERGITCYYAGEYKAGAKQFVDYQTYHSNDVENAVWRYLCQVPVDGKEKALAAILPIRNDRRVPMMEIYRLFKGDSTPERVLEVLAASPAEGAQAKHQAFDAHLYLALFYDSEGQLGKATKHVDLAVKQFEKGDYMWAVAVEHQKHLRRKVAAATKKKRAGSESLPPETAEDTK